LPINELNVESKICKMEKGEIRRENKQILHKTSLSGIYEEGGQFRSQDKEGKPTSNRNSPTIEHSG
jgi:hypothetical protein